jgi:hypothetical protein
MASSCKLGQAGKLVAPHICRFLGWAVCPGFRRGRLEAFVERQPHQMQQRNRQPAVALDREQTHSQLQGARGLGTGQ